MWLDAFADAFGLSLGQQPNPLINEQGNKTMR